MYVAVLRVHFHIHAGSLKEKRMVVRSVVDRVRSRYNAAAAEVADNDAHTRVTIAVACVSNEAAHADRQVQTIADAIVSWRLDAELLDIETEVIAV